MNTLEQLATLIVFGVIGIFALITNVLRKKVSRLESKLQDETFYRLHREAKDEILRKSNTDLVDAANKRYGGGEDR